MGGTEKVLPEDPLWNVDEVAYYLGVPKSTLYQWRTLAQGPDARRVGRHLRYRPEEVRAWVANLTTGVAA